MIRLRYFIAVIVLLIFWDLFLFASSSQTQCFTARELDVNTVFWNRLVYKTKTFFGKVTIEVQQKTQPVNEDESIFITSPTGRAMQNSDSDLFYINVSSVIKPLIGTTEFVNSQAWYDPMAFSVLQRTRLRQGKEKWQKIYRFSNKGVYRLRKKPSGTVESNLPLDRWTNVEGSFYSYGLGVDNCTRVIEPSILLYFVSKSKLEEKDSPLNLCVFGKKQLHQVQIRKEGIKRLKINYIEESKENSTLRKGETETVKFSFTTR